MVARLRDAILYDTRASQPAATAVDVGTLYGVSDEGGIIERSNGTTWDSMGGTVDDPLQTGTSFPGAPTTGDRYRRSDLDYQVFFYDGTRWLTEQVFHQPCPNNMVYADAVIAGTANAGRGAVLDHYAAGVLVMDVSFMYRVQTTNNGSNYWTMEFGSNDGTGLTAVATVTSAAESPDTFYRETVAVDAVVDTTTELMWTTRETATGSPGAINQYGVSFSYRGIAT